MDNNTTTRNNEKKSKTNKHNKNKQNRYVDKQAEQSITEKIQPNKKLIEKLSTDLQVEFNNMLESFTKGQEKNQPAPEIEITESIEPESQEFKAGMNLNKYLDSRNVKRETKSTNLLAGMIEFNKKEKSPNRTRSRIQ